LTKVLLGLLVRAQPYHKSIGGESAVMMHLYTEDADRVFDQAVSVGANVSNV
jgi:uncharacterized glyoxalase superfamily protein PhnB